MDILCELGGYLVIGVFILPGILLIGYSMFLLEKHNWDKKFFGDKWGILGIVCFLIGVIIFGEGFIVCK